MGCSVYSWLPSEWDHISWNEEIELGHKAESLVLLVMFMNGKVRCWDGRPRSYISDREYLKSVSASICLRMDCIYQYERSNSLPIT